MFGGYSLLRLLGRARLSAFQLTYFRAGHAHAGVLLVLALAYLGFLARTDFGTGLRWLAGAILAVGIIAQSGGLFLHMGTGESGRWSAGNSVTVIGAGLLAVSTLLLAYGVATSTQL
jgi:heme/copper-type cytochrome/quinol oxidase subunit 4